MAYLSLEDVSFTYPNGYEAVRHIDLDFELGESVAMIGQNGAGKTTTVKLMNGLLRPTTGRVLLEGQDTSSLTTAQISKSVGYVFQNPDDQIFQGTIYNEIAFGPKNQKLSPTEVTEQVQYAAKLCGLEQLLDEHPYNLPYSKRKFVTIAAIIAMNPDVIILDEPTAGQDRLSTERLSQIIDHLASNQKIVLTITHDMEFVVSQFERVIVFAEKEKQKEGTPREIFWDAPLLAKSRLKQPYISQLAQLLGDKGVMTIEELLEVEGYEKAVD